MLSASGKNGKAAVTPSVTLDALLALPPANTATTPVGLPPGRALRHVEEEGVWVPLVHILSDTTTTAASPSPALRGTEKKSGASNKVVTVSAFCSRYEKIPPLYVFMRTSFTLGKVVDAVVLELELHRGRFTDPTRRPQFLFVIPSTPPAEATPAMYPPQPLSGTVSTTVSGAVGGALFSPSPGERTGKTNRRHEVILFLSNRDTLPEEVLEAIRENRLSSSRPQKENEESTCLVM